MSFTDWLKDTFGEDGSVRNVNDWIDEHVFGQKTPKEYQKGGSKYGQIVPPGEIEKDNIVSRNIGVPVTSGLERVASALSWLYDNGVSQPLSTVVLQGSRSAGDLFSTREWVRAWRAADHISPGQAWFMGRKPGGETETEKALSAPLVYAKPSAASLPPGFEDLPEAEQQKFLREAGMPAVGNVYVEKLRRDSTFFRYSSGAGDFMARWWLDPVIVGGKLAGAARMKYIVKPRPAGGWSSGDIAQEMASSNMAKAQKWLFENRDNSQLLNNLSMARKSAMGPRFGGIVSTLRSPEEVAQFLRVSMGDVEARAALESENLVAANRLQADTSRLSNLELNLDRFRRKGQERYAAMVQERIDEVTRQINADEELVSRYQGMLSHYGELDQINLTRWSFARAQRRTKAQSEYMTGPALGFSRVGQSFFGTPLTVVRSLGEAHPSGYVRIDDIHADSVAEVRAHLARIPGITAAERQNLLNSYLKTTTEGQRLDVLDEIGFLGMGKLASKYGLTAEDAAALYSKHRAELAGAKEQIRRYSATNFPGESIHVDEFMSAGGNLSVHPNTVSRLANDHVLMDLERWDKALARHASAIKALRTAAGKGSDLAVEGLDFFNHLWKFGTLFRLGYIPRVLADDLAGQVARLGAASMALRTGYGAKNLATNLYHWAKPGPRLEAQEAAYREGVRYADDELRIVAPEAARIRQGIEERRAVAARDLVRARDRHRRAVNALNALDPAATPAVSVAARQRLVDKRAEDVRRLEGYLSRVGSSKQGRLAQLDEQISHLSAARDNAVRFAEEAKAVRQRGFQQSSQLYKRPEVALGVVLPEALGGSKGEYYTKLISADESLGQLFASNKQLLHGNLMRSYDQAGVAISYPQSEKLFVDAWHKAINHQLAQDRLAIQAIKGASIEQMTKWLSHTPEGRAYRRRLGLKYEANDRIAASVYHDVAEYLPTPEIRQAALEGKADLEFLKEAAANGMRPAEVHTAQLAEGLAGTNNARKTLDRVIDMWFKTVNSLPADRMSRHPLFNQLYEGHAKTLASQEMKQGVKLTQKDADRLAETARRLALRDTKRLVFDIAHRSDAAQALRFISPFFAATTESFQRWARIIADRPQTVGYAYNFFNAPAAMGVLVDNDGNDIHPDGYAYDIDPKTGKAVKKLVPKGDRRILVPMPKFIADGPVGKSLGMDSSGNWSISQNSMNMITQGDPWFNPGTGPIVSIPVNELVKDKPDQAELARHLGVLPFGPSTQPDPLRRGLDQALPGTIRNFLTAFDTSDERYQRIRLQIMQKAAYEHANLGKPMPSASEIADMTRSYWLWSATSAFIQPFATQKPDKYQFFRDQYNALRRKNPLTADQEYLERFGESHFIFAQATSTGSGIPATKKAVKLSQEYADLIGANPELAALIIGPEGEGPFSPEAYAYQLTTPLIPGGSEMQRTKMSADEAMKENQRRLGWAKFTKLMNQVTAELHSAGFNSFSDAGAEQFDAMRSAVAHLYGDPVLPDGSKNPYYNAEWSKDYYTLDSRRYDRLVPALEKVAYSPLADNPNRSDLRTLQAYLTGRQALLSLLSDRGNAGGDKTLRARSNSDLAQAWSGFVDSLIERDTRFGDLHSRYLSRDLGVDLEDMVNEEVA